METLLAIDLSTSCTGWALFNLEDGKLLEYGALDPVLPKGHTKFISHKKALYTMNSMAQQVKDLVMSKLPRKIVIEQINRGINRLAQKTLDGVHWMVLEELRKQSETFLDIVEFMDTIDWRGELGIRLTDADKKHNAEMRKRKDKKSVIDFKKLSVRYVNAKHGTQFTLDQNDITDAICLGEAFWRLLPSES